MEILSPFSYFPNTSWLLGESKSTGWSPEENKLFENALAKFNKDTPDRWHKVAAMVPGKTVSDVMKQYKELEDDVSSIEAGLVPMPGYSQSPFTLEWGNSTIGFNGYKDSFGVGGKRHPAYRISDHERKKGVPWTEEEHMLFLLGLKKYGKGDWRNISRNYVISRTPTQVASHAQKYFIRQHSAGKDKRRASIHDITTFNLNNSPTPSPDPSLMDQSNTLSPHMNSTATSHKPYHCNQPNDGAAAVAFSHTSDNMIMSPYMVNPHRIKEEDQHFERGSIYDSSLGAHDMFFQMQSGLHYPHG